MSTFVACFVKAPKERVVEALSELGGFTVGSESFGLDIDYKGSDKLPKRMLAASSQNDWTTVFYNTFNKLEEWATGLSDDLETQVIVAMAQSVSDYYYFALYDKGKKLREIEVCYSEDFDQTNFGNRFAFEDAEPGLKTDHGYIFDMEAIEKYASNFGLDVFHELGGKAPWLELKKGWF